MAPEPAGNVLQLPVQVISPTDLSQLLRELETIDDFLRQAAIRTPGVGSPLPRSSKLLEELASINKFNFLQAADRQAAKQFLTILKAHAPTVHISFASNPSASFITKLVTWLRSNIHPQLMVRVGLEPAIAAGCILRTTNRQFDFSLRQNFAQQQDVLLDLIDKSSKEIASE